MPAGGPGGHGRTCAVSQPGPPGSLIPGGRCRDGLLIPGGQSPDHLRADPRMVEFVKAFDRAGKLVAAVCHGPQLLIAAHLVKGRTLTAWQTVQDDLQQMGATVKDEPVVKDRNWITSRKPDDLEAFSAAIVEELEGGSDARKARASEPAARV